MAAMETKPSSSNEEIQPSNPQSTLSIDSSEQVITPQLSAQEGSETNVLDSSVKRKREEEDEDEEENPSGGGGGGEVESSSNPNPLWKTSLCSYFRRQESCSHGDACRYAHGEAELRPRPDNSWDPTSERAKHLSMMAVIDPPVEDPPLDDNVLDKCLIGLPRNWVSEKLKSHLNDLGIAYETAKKKKGMTVGFVGFANAEQVKSAIEVLNEKTSCGKHIKVADAIRRFHEKNPMTGICCDERIGQPTENHSGSEDSAPISSSLIVDDDVVDKDRSLVEGMVSKIKSVRDVVTPLAHMPYSDQLEHKKNSLLQTLKRLTRSARKACPHAVSLPEWILKSRDIGGLPCKWEGILSSPIIDGYRNKCEFSVGYSLQGKRTVGFMLGNFREGMTAVEEPVNCPNVSRISCKFALIFQDFLQSSVLPSWNRINNTGFWRQLTVREGRNPGQVDAAENLEAQIAEVMLIIQVCSLDVDEGLIKSEFERMTLALAQGASACSPPLPLTTIFVQDHQGISNVAPADCPLHSLLVPNVGRPCSEKPDVAEARIHDYISNLRFCISPTAFFQVNTLAAEKLYSLAGDWADLSPDTLLFDICCGTGSIGLTLAHRVGMVVGIEMNDSAVSDACRNAEINGIKNCRFVCGKAENVMGALLKEYLNVPQQHDIASNVSVGNHKDNDESEVNNICDKKMLHPIACTSAEVLATNDTAEEMPSCSEDKSSCSFDVLGRPEQHFSGKTSHGEGSIDHNETIGCSGSLASQENHVSEENKGAKAAPLCQFKDVVAIVDPPRAGLHPIVIKALRTHPRIRRLVYISCNPESLVANAIELCTPTADKPEKGNNSRGWRKMGSNGLARQRVKSMPNSEPFKPVKAMAVDMFPHTVHCEMVMLLER